MKSIKKEVSIEIVIKKSTFINYLMPVKSVEDANEKLDILKKKYNDANHHCFAYIIGKNQEIQKYSDDGEPSKTAGYPMIEVLKKHDLTNVLSVTIRYFGGIKLGAGGLVRAYTKSTANTITLAKFTYLENYTELLVTVDFNQIGNVEKYIRDHFKLQNTTYEESVTYSIILKTVSLESFKTKITNLSKGNASIDIKGSYDIYE